MLGTILNKQNPHCPQGDPILQEEADNKHNKLVWFRVREMVIEKNNAESKTRSADVKNHNFK